MISKHRILMVDGDSIAAANLKEAFSKIVEKLEFTHVYSAEEGLDFLRSQGEYEGALRPHLIICELDLPGGNALDFIIQVKGDTGLMNVPLAVYTETQMTSLISGAYKLKIACCIPKPGDKDAVQDIARDLVHFFLKKNTGAGSNPLLDVLHNTQAAKAKVGQAKPLPVVEDNDDKKTSINTEERRKFARVRAPVKVKTRVFTSVELGRLIQALSQPNPNLEELVTLDDKDDPVLLTGLDLSEAGMGAEGYPDLLGAHSFDRGTHLAMVIEMANIDKPIRAVGQVMWSKEVKKNLYRAGLMFLSIAHKDRQILQGFVAGAAAK